MSFNRTSLNRRCALFGLLALGGCGFAPVYGTGGAAETLRGSVMVTAPDTVAGYRLRTRLTDRLGAPSNPRYLLATTLARDETPATITVDGDTTRFNLNGNAEWTLTDTTTGQKLDGGQVSTFTSYSAAASTVATQTAQSDAQDRLTIALADLIVARVLITASGAPQ